MEDNKTEKPLVNRVANSTLEVLNLEDFYPRKEILEFDIKDFLFRGLLLREKEYRTALKEMDWEVYRGRQVALFCSADAIVPTWAYMLASSYLTKVKADIFYATKEEYLNQYYADVLRGLDWEKYDEKRVVIKGCSQHPVPESAYVRATVLLQDYAQSIMFGEPCSTVPLFKRPRRV